MSGIDRRRLLAADEDERGNLLDSLAEAAAEGDDAAAADLAWAVREFRLARPALHQYLFSAHDIEAAEQATLVATALRIGSFRSESRFTTWLYRVASNEAKQLLRAERRHTDRAEREPPEELAERFVMRVSSMVADQNMVQAAIAQLTENHRRALLLREEQGLTYVEIGEALGIPDATAKTWVRRARLELADRLSPGIDQR